MGRSKNIRAPSSESALLLSHSDIWNLQHTLSENGRQRRVKQHSTFNPSAIWCPPDLLLHPPIRNTISFAQNGVQFRLSLVRHLALLIRSSYQSHIQTVYAKKKKKDGTRTAQQELGLSVTLSPLGSPPLLRVPKGLVIRLALPFCWVCTAWYQIRTELGRLRWSGRFLHMFECLMKLKPSVCTALRSACPERPVLAH